MTKLEEIKERILERMANRELYSKAEKSAYLYGYLHSLKDTYEINSDEYFELLEELRYD